MKEEILFTIDAPYRPALPVRGWRFGNPEGRDLAVMGALRGNEIQQMYVCGRLISALQTAESEGALSPDCGILVVPCANQFSMNVGRRFWAADNTDINRMFPGYDQGETTQRIAARLFGALQGYRWGVHLTSFYLPGDHLPHVRMMDTGYQQVEEAAAFGLPYILVRTPQAYDTTTLNYNWQIWNTQAFSLYSTSTECADDDAARLAVESILRFLAVKGAAQAALLPGGGPAPHPAGERPAHRPVPCRRPDAQPPRPRRPGGGRGAAGRDHRPLHLPLPGTAPGRLPGPGVLLPPGPAHRRPRGGFPPAARIR